jgi:hypothetical protein
VCAATVVHRWFSDGDVLIYIDHCNNEHCGIIRKLGGHYSAFWSSFLSVSALVIHS